MGERSWSDEDLRRAVSSQKSWRGILRALGLKSNSGGSIGVVKRRSEALKLDTNHFVGPRALDRPSTPHRGIWIVYVD
jgi:hypothetical protein